MIIPVVFPSAAAFWLNHNETVNLNHFGLDRNRSVTIPDSYDLSLGAEQQRELQALFPGYFPFTVMSPRNARKHYRKSIVKTVSHPLYLPDNGFVQISREVFVASPELCFLQAARHLEPAQLILFGNELCGRYVYDEQAELKQRDRSRITSAESIISFLEKAQKCYGHRKALQAGRYLLDNSYSRMESMLAAFISMKLFMGGYALDLPVLNARLNLSGEGKTIMHGRDVYGDIVWEDKKLIAEYDSDLTHLTSRQHKKDKQRSSAISVSGYQMISITKSDVETLSAMDDTFRTIRKVLGIKSEAGKFEKYREERRKVLKQFRTFRSNDPGTYPDKL